MSKLTLVPRFAWFFFLLSVLALSPRESVAQAPANTLLAVYPDLNQVDVLSAVTGIKTGEFGTGLFSGAWDVKQIGTAEKTKGAANTCLVATTDGRLVQLEIGTGARVAPDITVPNPDNRLSPNLNRRITVVSSKAAILWIRDLMVGYYFNLTSGALIGNFSSNAYKIEGLELFENSFYGVDVDGRVLKWNRSGGQPIAVSEVNGHGGGYMSQPVLGDDGFIYALSRPGGNSPVGTWLGRFRPTPSRTSPKWDPTFGVTSDGWRFGNYLTRISKGNLALVLLEYGNGQINGLGRFDTRTRTFSGVSGPFLYSSLAAIWQP